MNEETTAEPASNGSEELLETSGLAVEPKAEPIKGSSKKPFGTATYRNGTAYVGLNQAARLTGAAKSNIHNKSNNGELGFETNEKGQRIYQVAELERVFGKLKAPEPEKTVSQSVLENPSEPSEPDHRTALEIALLKQENQFLKQQLEAEAEKARRADNNAADWKQQAERVTLMLTHRPEPEPKPEPVPEPKRGFFGSLFGGRG